MPTLFESDIQVKFVKWSKAVKSLVSLSFRTLHYPMLRVVDFVLIFVTTYHAVLRSNFFFLCSESTTASTLVA